MKRLEFVSGAAVLIGSLLSLTGDAAGRFDQKLAADKQIVHVLSRLTFGARPGDAAEVRRIGVDKWIDQQLHPEAIAENPVLAERIAGLKTLDLPTWKIQETYTVQAIPVPQLPRTSPLATMPPDRVNKLRAGTAEERMEIINSLDPESRKELFVRAPQQIFEILPQAVIQEAAKARQDEMTARQQELRRMNPPILELLTPDQQRMARTGTRDQKIALIDSFDAGKRRQVLRALGPAAFNDVPELRREAMAAQQPPQFVNSELIENKLLRAVYSNRQLEEVLVDFWMNHFNVFNGKGQGRILLTSYERDAIRPHVLGHFKDLLLATAVHPAMLQYLDNYQSQAVRDDIPQPFLAPAARRPGLNENYGREIMELHTLGVDGGYTQDDVIAVARAFTGWTIFDLAKYAEFQFNPAMHDRKEKIVLGHTLPPGRAYEDGLDVIDILARHPSTAKFISKKLAQRFVADEPPQQLVDRMADTFAKTGGDLRAVLQTLFASVEFMSEGAWQSKLKSPLEVAVSALRATNADVRDALPLSQRIADMGQPLYGKVEPTGYPNTGETWASTSGILARINFATAVTEGQLPGVKIDASRFNFKTPAAVSAEILGIAPSAAMLTAIEKGIEGKEVTPSMLTNLVLSSPEFQRR